MVASVEAKRTNNSWEAYISNGREPTGFDVIEWATRLEELGAGELLITSVDQEGTKRGFDLELLKKLESTVRIPIIASGGAGELIHFEQLDLSTDIQAVAVASVLHYNKLTVDQIKNVLPKSIFR